LTAAFVCPVNTIMNILELDSYNLDDAVKFNDHLNPRLWDASEHLKPEVRDQLLKIAEDFREFLGVTDLDLQDITISGSNAAYTYTPNSDIDLHLVVKMPDNEVYRELFDAKKFQYNEQHNIKIGGYDVELYVQDADAPHISQGVYSVLNNDWLQVPRRRRANVDDSSTKNKYEKVGTQIERAIKSGNLTRITRLAEKIKKMRQTGLEAHGEFGPENLAFKMLRSQGLIKQLYDARNAAKDQELSLDERRKSKKKKRVKYGFGGYWYPGTGYAGQDTPAAQDSGGGDGGGESIKEDVAPSNEEILKDFIRFCVAELKIKSMPTVKLRRDPQWSVVNKTFGRYNNDAHTLEVAFGQRHIMDVLRTVAHELTHKHQHEREEVPSDAGETGSRFENEANARAGILMRDYGRLHPELFNAGETELEESASGYIPTKKQAKDPRWSMALTQDIRPGQLGKEANKLNLKTNKQGVPQVANPNGLFEELYREFKQYKTDEDYSPDNPPGPESKPTMPKGTVRVDVSDVYDWYKLGQHISNMKGLGQHDFGKGPPSSIISFGDENTEHEFIKDLEATGLDVTDIDPVDPKQPPGKKIKTDPAYDVDEAIHTPVTKDRDAEQYYKFIVGKAKLGRPLTRQEQDYVKMYQVYRQQKLAESVEQLDEVKMSPSALQKWAKSPEAQGIRAGFEAELIFRDTASGDDSDYEMEPDYDMDERARSISQVIDFFQGGDYGGLSERQVSRLTDDLDESYMEWLDEEMRKAFRDEQEDLIKKVLVDENDWDLDNEIQKQLELLELSDDEMNAIIQAGEKAPKFNSSKEQILYAEANPLYDQYMDAQSAAEDLLDELVQDSIRAEDKFYDAALDDFRDGFYLDDDSGFFDDTGNRWMSDIASNYDLDWPYMTGGGGNGGSRDWDEIGDSLQSVIDMPVKVSSNYHSTTRKEGLWIVEPDSSLEPDDSEDFGLEIVSPPLPLEQALEKLQQVTDWANSSEGNAYTNSSTGLHMGVSVPFKGGDVDYLKLILFLGDEYVLQRFGREANTYTKSAMRKFRENLKGGRSDPMGVIKLMQHNLLELAYKEIQKGVGEGKYTSAHIQKGYIEFRSAGGDWLAEENADPEVLQNTMLRYARAMSLAANPGEERREYAKKLYKLVAPEGDGQLALFSQFASGELTAEQLKKLWAEKTIGAETNTNKRWKLFYKDGTPVPGAEWNGYTEDQVKNAVWSKWGREALDTGEYELRNMSEEQQWEVYAVDSGKTLEIVKGKNKGEVADKVYDKYVDQGIGFNVRPYTDPATMTPRAKLAKRIAQPNTDVKNTNTNNRYEIVDRRNNRVVLQYTADSESSAGTKFNNWLTNQGMPVDTENYGYRPEQAVNDVATDVAQNFANPQNATDRVGSWSIYDVTLGREISRMDNVPWQQANDRAEELERFTGGHNISVRGLQENFADGKGPGRPGDSQRHGIPKGATMAQLEKAAKAPGRKGQLARWQLNMRRGKKK
jgi:hypothetical protein